MSNPSIEEPNETHVDDEDLQDIYSIDTAVDEEEDPSVEQTPTEDVEEPEAQEEPTEEPAEPEGEATKPEEDDKKLTEEAARLIGAEIARGMQQTQKDKPEEKPAPKSLSPEERDKLLKRVLVSPAMLEGLGFSDPTPEQVESFQALVDGIAQYGFTMSAAQTQLTQRQLSEKITPIQQAVEAYQNQQMQAQFFGKYPVLEKYPTALREAANRVSPTDETGKEKSLDQVYEEVAAQAVAIIQEFSPDFDISAATHSAPSSHNKVPEMSTGMKGGRSQGGVATKTTPNDADADIYS